MRFLLGTAAAAGILAIVGSTGCLAASTTPTQPQASSGDPQMAATVRDLEARLDRDEATIRQLQGSLPTPPSAAQQYCSDGYDSARGECN